MLIEGSDYHVRVIPFPNYTTGGMVMPNDDGSYSIYINALLPDARKRKALGHELEHIEDDDFYNGKPIEEIEDI